MRVTETVEVGEVGATHQVSVRELTTAEMRGWFKSHLIEAEREQQEREPAAELDAVNALLLEDISLTDLCRFTDLQPADLDALTQSELRAIHDKAKELNAAFFAMLGRIKTAGLRALAAGLSAGPTT